MRSLANPWCRPAFRVIFAQLFWKLCEAQKIFTKWVWQKKSGSKVRKIEDYRELMYQNWINSQICKEKHGPKYFPQFVRSLNRFSYFPLSPYWVHMASFVGYLFGALYACLKTINILFGLQWGRQKCKMFIGRLRNMISGWVHVHLLMNISEFTQCPKMAYNALAMNHYTASVSLSTYCNCCCFRQKHSFISPTPFPDFWINLWEEIIYCMV